MRTRHVFGPLYILRDGKWTQVVAVRDYEPGEHDGSHIKAELPAREWVTDHGSRWVGVHPDGTLFHAPSVATRRDGSDERFEGHWSQSAKSNAQPTDTPTTIEGVKRMLANDVGPYRPPTA
jgi:hypothetical protein